MELFRLLGTIAIENSEANQAIDVTTDKAGKSESKMSKFFGNVGNFALKCGKVIATGLAVGATAIAGLTTAVTTAYADYEQLIGGVETLYGASIASIEEYAEKHGIALELAEQRWERYQQREEEVLADAREAYKTAGMSVNEYMETVNGFAASLVSSLGEYEHHAASTANMIVTDMADNANKMGTSMESIQNAYSGFAKQNYTMLDNLKLGYGGTKEEMQRLLDDAAELAGVEMFDINSFADVAEAIHIIQEEMGITGTTAEEASKTISGSIASMKAAWQNLLVGLADGNQDIDVLISNLGDSILTVGDNLIPRIQQTLEGIGALVEKVVPQIVQKLPPLLMEVLPGLLGTAITLMQSIITTILEALPELVQMIIEQLPNFITQIATALVEMFPILIDTAKQVGTQIMDAINGALSTYEGGAFTGLIGAFNTLQTVVSDVFQNSIMPLCQDFLALVGELWTENEDKINKIGELFSLVFQAIGAAIGWLVGIIRDNMDGIKAVFQSSLDIIGGIVDFFIALFKGNWSGMFEAAKNIVVSVFEAIMNQFNLIKAFFTSILSSIWSVVVEKFENIKLSISEKITQAKDSAIAIFENMKEAVSTVFENLKTALVNIWNGIWGAIKGVINSILGGIEGMVNGVLSGINKLLDGIEEVANAAGELLGFDPISITLSPISLPRLAKGGVLEKGQVGLLEGDGAEAVVPLEKNREWIQRVSEEMKVQGIGGDERTLSVLQEILYVLQSMRENDDNLPDTLLDAIANGLTFNINNREFARLVKAVN